MEMTAPATAMEPWSWNPTNGTSRFASDDADVNANNAILIASSCRPAFCGTSLHSPHQEANRMSGVHDDLGSSTSRSQSPIRINERLSNVMNTPGNDATHHAVASNCRPSANMRPQVTVGGCTPNPRKLKDASRMTTAATFSVATTTIGATIKG